MRTRQTSYNNYGLSTDSVKRLMKQAQNGKFDIELMRICVETYPELAKFLYVSVGLGVSYDKLEALMERNVPISRNDFYGYRRLVLSEFAKLFN